MLGYSVFQTLFVIFKIYLKVTIRERMSTHIHWLMLRQLGLGTRIQSFLWISQMDAEAQVIEPSSVDFVKPLAGN